MSEFDVSFEMDDDPRSVALQFSSLKEADMKNFYGLSREKICIER
jgi:hypothetical protein